LLALVEAPFFAAFGVSVQSGRIAILGFAVLAVIAWFAIVRRLYNDEIAVVAALLFATTPFIVDQSRVVLSEMPALAITLVTVLLCLRFAESLRMRDALWFACAAGLSPYAPGSAYR
jgi:4-amino-4-deoxy-L-arabinose transferase-like glycosyltransferase